MFGGDAGLGKRVEEGGLAYVRQTDDSAFERHI